MEWIDIDTLTIDSNTTRTLNQIIEKEKSLDLENIPPLLIDVNGKIIDGVKRYFVLAKHGFDKVPVVRNNIRNKVFVSYNANRKVIHMLAA